MRILLTGGAGFIGSHTGQLLLSEGHEVIVVDEINDYYDPQLKMANLEVLQAAGLAQFYQSDISDRVTMGEIFERHRPEAVIHLAARAGVRPSLDDPFLYERTNVHGTMVLLDAARRCGVRKFVFASSSSIYGVANRVPFSEEDCVNLPVSPYAATKIAGEKLCYTWSHLYGLSCVSLRLFTVYGPRQRPDLAIRKFTELITAGETVPMFGDGSTGRDYTFVEDTVAGIRLALDYETRYDVFNLGNSQPVTLAEMIDAIAEAVGRPALIKRLPDQPGDVPITYADISKAKRLLGYSPNVPFVDGVRRFVEWYRSCPRSSVALAASGPLV